MITADFLVFLRDLSQNNNRDWFEKNKSRFEKSVKEPFSELVTALITSFETIDPEIRVDTKDTLFRIYKDVRFSKDKSPYKTHMGAVISRYGRKEHTYPGYYVHSEFGNFMFGGGAYSLEKEPLEKVRNKILREPDRFTAIIHNPDFVQHFGGIKGDKNKKLSAEFAAMQGTIPEIANKQFYFMAEMEPETILRTDLVPMLTKMAATAMPLNTFLKEALA